MRLNTSNIQRLAGLGEAPTGQVMVNGVPIRYLNGRMKYRGQNWVVSDDQDFIINRLGAPIGAIVQGSLVPLDEMSVDQHAVFQPKYGYQRVTVYKKPGSGDGRLGFGFHLPKINLPHINIPLPHINLPSRDQLIKAGRVAAGGLMAFSGGAGLIPGVAKLFGQGGGGGDGGGAAPADSGAQPSQPSAGYAPGYAPPGYAPGYAPPTYAQPSTIPWGIVAPIAAVTVLGGLVLLTRR